MSEDLYQLLMILLGGSLFIVTLAGIFQTANVDVIEVIMVEIMLGFFLVSVSVARVVHHGSG